MRRFFEGWGGRMDYYFRFACLATVKTSNDWNLNVFGGIDKMR